jgi:hypothetical protein
VADPKCSKVYELEQDGDCAIARNKSTEFAGKNEGSWDVLGEAAELVLRQHYRLKPHIDVF